MLWFQVLTYLKSKPKELDDGEFESLVGTIVNHSLSVISLFEKFDKRKVVTQSCITVS